MNRILIVDDNEKNIRLLTGMLTFQGFQVDAALSGAAGLGKALSIHPDLILMDVQMPGMSGTETMQKLKNDEHLRKTPIVAITAMAMTGSEKELLEAGFDGYLSKPISFDSLLAAVKRFLK